LYIDLAGLQTVFLVPPTSPREEWKTLPQAFHESRSAGREDPIAVAAAGVLGAYLHDDAKDFNKALAEYQKQLEKRAPDPVQVAGFETFYNHFAPFSWCPWLYLVVFVLACLSWLVWAEPLRRAAFWLTVLLVVVHTWGLFARMYMMDRPLVFVTNL